MAEIEQNHRIEWENAHLEKNLLNTLKVNFSDFFPWFRVY